MRACELCFHGTMPTNLVWWAAIELFYDLLKFSIGQEWAGVFLKPEDRYGKPGQSFPKADSCSYILAINVTSLSGLGQTS